MIDMSLIGTKVGPITFEYTGHVFPGWSIPATPW